jgi:hypothetical protein
MLHAGQKNFFSFEVQVEAGFEFVKQPFILINFHIQGNHFDSELNIRLDSRT